jgi:predicted nucleotidyltransferase
MKEKTTNENLNTVQTELDMLTDIIANTVPVEEIYLFGSYAYGTPHKDSDLDLYVVLKNEAEMREIDAMLAIGRAIARKKTMPIDIMALKLDRFIERKQCPTMEKKIVTEGIKIYG